MNLFRKTTLIACLMAAFSSGVYAQNDLKLWYDKPAQFWEEALPVGNGRIGAMVYGNPLREEIQLNEETVSAGAPYSNHNPDARMALPAIRQLIFQGKYAEAQAMCGDNVLSKNGFGMPYQTVGSLWLDFPGHDKFTGLHRELDIENAISTVRYNVGDTEYVRETFASFPDELLIVRLTASKPGSLTFGASLTCPQQVEVKASGRQMSMQGVTKGNSFVDGALNFRADMDIRTEGGKVTSNDSVINVTNANAVTIYISMATNFVNYKDISANPVERNKEYMKNSSKSYTRARAAHIAAYQHYFNRVSIDLGTSEQASKPTDVRIREFAKSNDPQLVSLFFQFGRYLLISCSQPGGQPANLQGIWNQKLNPAWRCRYTTNINAEMNYWPAEVTNLPEMHEPFLKMIEEIAESGSVTAREMYGCRGWMMHHNTDLWRMTGAVDRAYCGPWPTCSAWLCQHLWDRYLFSGDKEYLARVYPLMKSASEFFVDFLVEDPNTGYMVVTPSNSPENSPRWTKKSANLFAGITMDNQLVFDLFSNTERAAGILEKNELFTDTIAYLKKRLPPMQIGQYGQIQEWFEDWDQPNDRHRHISHLWGLYPGYQISAYTTPVLLEGARNTLTHRGDPSTGWAMGWKVCLWARMLDGNHAYQLIKNQLTYVNPEVQKGQGGGTYPNMFDAHPPFQIDGNFGCAAGIAEMLVQSHDQAVHLLPALPDDWKSGEVKGLRTRGGFEIVEMKWTDGKISGLKVKSNIGGTLRLRVPNQLPKSAVANPALKTRGKVEQQSVAIAQIKDAMPYEWNAPESAPVDSAIMRRFDSVIDNPFFATQKISRPMVSERAVMSGVQLKETFIYDIATEAGMVYEINM